MTPALNFENKGTSVQYYEWEQNKNGTSWKEQIRQAIDELIGTVNSLDELLLILEERGYEIKWGKYISIRAPGQERFVRTKTLGEEYTEESLKTRILSGQQIAAEGSVCCSYRRCSHTCGAAEEGSSQADHYRGILGR